LPNVKSRTEAGFSLVETVAAMGILALAAIPLLQVTTDASRNAASLESRLLARPVAENVMARSMATREVIDAGISAGQETQLGRTYNWVHTASEARVGELQNIRVDVRPEQSEQVLASLVSLKYLPDSLPGLSTTPEEEPS